MEIILIVIAFVVLILTLWKPKKVDRYSDKPIYYKEVRGKVIRGVCLGYDLKPHLSFEGGNYLLGNLDRILFPEFFIEGQDWPVDPDTKEKLPIHYI